MNIEGVVVSEKIQTTTKVRVLAGHSHSSKQQVIRIDYESDPVADDDLSEQIRKRLRRTIATANAFVISDYNYGVVNQKTVELIAGQNRRLL